MRTIARMKEETKVKARTEARNSIIDEYGKIDEEIKRLSKIKDELREKIIEAFPEGTHSGQDYSISINHVQSITLDPVAVAKTIGVKDTLRIASISVEKAKALMSPEDVEKCTSEVKETIRLSVRRNG